MFRRICKAAGLVEERTTPEGRTRRVPRFSPHSLRHTYAALNLQNGVDVYYVSRQLGHADISLTVHTYGAWLQPHRRPSLDALDRTAPDHGFASNLQADA
jgi:integrase